MQPDPKLESAWESFLATLRDRRELSDYQIQRTREIFEAGWKAAKSVRP